MAVRFGGDGGAGARVAVVGGAHPALPVGQRPVAAHVVVPAARRIAASPVRRAAVRHQVRRLLGQHGGRQVLRPVPVVVGPERRGGEARHLAAVPGGPGHPPDQRRPGEQRRGGVVGVVGVALLLAVPAPDGLAAVLDVGVRVHGVQDARPVLLEQPGQYVDQPVVGVRTRLPERGAVGDDGRQHQPPVLPEAGQAQPPVRGVHGGVDEDQLDPAAAVGERVDLGAVAAVQLDDGLLPRGEPAEAEQGRVRLAEPLVARGGVRGLVGHGHRAARHAIYAGGLTAGQIDADQWRSGVEGLLGVRVHEVQVVVRVGEDLHHQGRVRGAYRQSGRRVRGRIAAAGRRGRRAGAEGRQAGRAGRRQQGAPRHSRAGCAQGGSIRHTVLRPLPPQRAAGRPCAAYRIHAGRGGWRAAAAGG